MKRWIIFLGLMLLAVGCNKKTPDAIDFLQGDFAFVAHKSSVHVINIADPAQPEQVTTIALPGRVLRVLADGRFAYILYEQFMDGNNGGLQIVDMAEPGQPTVRTTYNTPNLPTNAAMQNNLLVLTDWEGVTLLDVADKDNPQVLAELPYASNGLYLDGEQLLTTWGGCDFRSDLCAGGLRVYDVSNPREPTEVSDLEQHELPGFDVAIANGYAFINSKGVWATALTGEPTLQINGRYQTGPGYAHNGQIAIQDNIAYTQQNDGLYLLDISQPDTPTELGRYRTTDYLFDLTVRGQYAYLVGENDLKIVDIADPANPALVGRYLANP